MTTEVMVIEELSKYPASKTLIDELKLKCVGLSISGIEDKEGYNKVHEVRMEIKNNRVAFTTAYKDSKKETKLFWDKVDEKVTAVNLELSSMEDPLYEMEKEIDTEKERIKQEKIRQEQEKLQSRINRLMAYKTQIVVESLRILKDDEFEAYFEKVKADFEIEQARIAEEKAKEDARIAEEKRLKDESDAKIAAEKAIEDARIAAIKKAEDEKKAEEQRIESDRLARITEDQKIESDRLAAVAAEQAKIAADLKAKQDKIDADKKKEADRIDLEAKNIQDAKNKIISTVGLSEPLKVEIEMINTPLREYNWMRHDSHKLSMLEAGGVDNWEWYGESLYGIENECPCQNCINKRMEVK